MTNRPRLTAGEIPEATIQALQADEWALARLLDGGSEEALAEGEEQIVLANLLAIRRELRLRGEVTIEVRRDYLETLADGALEAISASIYGTSRVPLRRTDHICAILDYEYGYRQTRTVYPDWENRVLELQAEYERRTA